MHHEIRDNQLYLQRLSEEKEHLIQRLNRIEGQVRGLRQMIENDRYSGDMAQQTSAASAAVREVTLLLISQHRGCHSVGGGEWGREWSARRGDTRYPPERHQSSNGIVRRRKNISGVRTISASRSKSQQAGAILVAYDILDANGQDVRPVSLWRSAGRG
jgi:DNA-binding FrmR family transcriptional regulator